ncbi:helix-turn-helix domain-containing protein [Roseibium sp. LAB1]
MSSNGSLRRGPKVRGYSSAARNLLLQTERPVSEIALACGYDSASHFIRTYQNRFGATPHNQRLCSAGTQAAFQRA